jgi:hypothetical protein
VLVSLGYVLIDTPCIVIGVKWRKIRDKRWWHLMLCNYRNWGNIMEGQHKEADHVKIIQCAISVRSNITAPLVSWSGIILQDTCYRLHKIQCFKLRDTVSVNMISTSMHTKLIFNISVLLRLLCSANLSFVYRNDNFPKMGRSSSDFMRRKAIVRWVRILEMTGTGSAGTATNKNCTSKWSS